MEQPRSRPAEQFIITGHRSRWRYVLDLILTLAFWGYSIVIVVYFASALAGFDNGLLHFLNRTFQAKNRDIRLLVSIGVGLFLLFYVLLRLNRLYNIKQFGSLSRRRYPEPVTKKDLLALGLMDEKTIDQLQQTDCIVFETNPIVSYKDEQQP